jgi:hypothetical protein
MKAVASILLFLISPICWGVIPENGWWWNASESGRGFNIEIQNNSLFMASFGYDSNGSPMWIISSGPMTTERDYTGELFRSSFGQCFGCPYVAPSIVSAGTVTLRFSSSQTAILTVNGFSVNVQRFNFWLNETVPDAMLGQWSAVIGAAEDVIFDGERINYSGKFLSNGTLYATGSRLGSSSAANPALVSYVPAQGAWLALLDSSSSFYRLFIFSTTGFNRVEGSFWIYQKTANPTGPGMFYQAFRTASAARLQTGNGPGSSKSMADGDQWLRAEERDHALFQRMSSQGVGKLLDVSMMKIVEAMQTALESHKAARGATNDPE